MAMQEALKGALRLVLLAGISWLITQGGLTFVFDNFEMDPATKVQLIGFMTILLKAFDEYLHELGKEEQNETLKKGLTRF